MSEERNNGFDVMPEDVTGVIDLTSGQVDPKKEANRKRTEKARAAQAAKREERKKIQEQGGSGKKSKNDKIKKRAWAFVIYPESLPQDWLEQLRLTGLPTAISPLHDKDIAVAGADTDEEKKAHYHVIVNYSGPTTFATVKRLTDLLNAPQPIALESVRGYYRYLTHKDNPEKYQYDEKEIVLLNGFDITDFMDLSKSEVNAIIRKLQTLIRQNDVFEYGILMNYLQDMGMDYEYDVARSNTIFFVHYIKSMWRIAESEK